MENLDILIKEAIEKLNNCESIHQLNEVKAIYLGKNGSVSNLMKNARDLSIEEKKELGIKVNKARTSIEEVYNEKNQEFELKKIEQKLQQEKIDVTLPGVSFNMGTLHPMTRIIRDIEDLFLNMGYEIKDGPEIENDLYCFEMLNLPKNHPARDMQDSFYINPELLLRTHTSPVQVRTMLKEKADLRIICPGKVYRRDIDDATHSHQFMQIEGLVLGNNISLSNLKATLLVMARKMFGENRDIRLRPSYFPFTEPSVEVDVSCAKCGGKGCNICKHTGYIEVLGAGMVNNNVLEMCGYDSSITQGFAFGLGVERVAMLKYNIDDIRNFYTNDIRFLKNFKGGLN